MSSHDFVLIGLCFACFGLSAQADIKPEDHQTEKNVTGQNVSSLHSDHETSHIGEVDTNAFRPFQHENLTNGQETSTTLSPNAGYYPIIEGNQVPPPSVSGRDVALAFQWHVGVYSKTFTPYMQICGGTLVTLKAVISAAHCFWNDLEGALSATQFAVATGKRYRPWFDPNDMFNQKSDVSAIHIPPFFRGVATSFQGDIAVVLLINSFTTTPSVKPVCVLFDEEFERQQLQTGKLGTVLGWGLTQENGAPSPILNYIELPFVDVADCLASAAPDFQKYITTDKICAGVTTGKALCRGDSGGGWVVQDTSASPAVPYLRGVASTAPRNEQQCNAHALAALTHVLSHRAFLLQHIPRLEDECQRHFPQVKVDDRRADLRKTKKKKGTKMAKRKSGFVCNCYCNNKKSDHQNY